MTKKKTGKKIPVIITLIKEVGGFLKTARELQVDKSVLYRWKKPHKKGGVGYIPPRYWRAVIILSGNKITLEQLLDEYNIVFPGPTVGA